MEKINMESEEARQQSEAVPILTSGIGRRISEACDLFGEKKRLAEVTGVSEASLYRYISEKSAPTIEPLAQLAAAAGVRLEWLATGRGPRMLSENAARFDVETLQAALETLDEALRLMGRTAPDSATKAALVAQVYSYLTDDAQDAGARMLGVLKLIK